VPLIFPTVFLSFSPRNPTRAKERSGRGAFAKCDGCLNQYASASYLVFPRLFSIHASLTLPGSKCIRGSCRTPQIVLRLFRPKSLRLTGYPVGFFPLSYPRARVMPCSVSYLLTLVFIDAILISALLARISLLARWIRVSVTPPPPPPPPPPTHPPFFPRSDPNLRGLLKGFVSNFGRLCFILTDFFA